MFRLLLQDVARLRQLAAVRGLVSTDLRARLWPILLNGADGQVAGPSRSASNSPVPGRHPSEGTASNAVNSTAVVLPGARKQLCTDYEQWSSGTHKDKSTVSNSRVGMQCAQAVVRHECKHTLGI